MKKFLYRIALLLLFIANATTNLHAQNVSYTAEKEKVYLHTNHVFFKPGETIYYKIYVVKAKNQAPSNMSSSVYVDVINPAGAVVQKQSFPVKDGYAEGSYDFGEGVSGGVYKLRTYTSWMRNEKQSTFFTKEITVQKQIAPRVLLKLDFLQKGYGPGSEVTADFSMRNLKDQPIRNYNAAYTVSIGGNAVTSGKFTTDAEGKCKVKFILPQQLNTTDGLLNITVNYDAYTEAISRSIPVVLNKIDLQFMPEGGTMVQGIRQHVAFKAVNELGKATDIKADVFDDKGNKITTIESFHFGMGAFDITPQKNANYHVRITAPAGITQEYYLPASTEKGVVLNVSRKDKWLHLSITATDAQTVKLVGQTKNTLYYENTIELKKGINELDIEEKKFPVGIAQLTVLNTEGIPVAERLAFLSYQNVLNISITADKQKYLPREKVRLTIRTTDENGKPLPANLSLSVLDDKLWSFADDKQDHILTWLLLNSELKGKVEEPQFYFKKDEPKALAALDLVMLTNGYRYFDYEDAVVQQQRLLFTPDLQNIVSGITTDAKGHPVRANIVLVSNGSNGSNGKVMQTVSNDEGKFFFSGLVPHSYYYLLAQSTNKNQLVILKIEQAGTGNNPVNYVALRNPRNKEEERFINMVGKPQLMRDEAVAVDFKAMPEMAIPNDDKQQLAEVVVTGLGMQRKALAYSAAVVNVKEIDGFTNVNWALQGKVPGVQITNQFNPVEGAKIKVRGAGMFNANAQPAFIVNNVPVQQIDIGAINPGDIETVTVLNRGDANALYGNIAMNGAVVITTKSFRSEKIRKYLSKSKPFVSQQFFIPGTTHTTVRKFYAPVYQSSLSAERNDFRETIYWNPVIQTGKDGEAIVEFFNSDASTTFRAIAEGIAWDGKPGRTEMTYAATNALTVDAKIPPYLTVGDKALLPVFIKNNYSKTLHISLEVLLPKNMLTGMYNHNFDISPDSSLQVLVPAEAIAALQGDIKFVIKSNVRTETLELPLTVADKGFPVVETFSGNQTKRHDFTVKELVPGSLHSQIKLFRNLEGQLLDGIQSMLREPYGCFEQTSSSTYPNIYVLKYLRESGKSNPEIEKLALGYIQRGYDRLIGFETAQNGFEWFGKTPPHEALTAYGLMEFMDMREFVKVDAAMLKRTKEFLMSRRDGKGSFTLQKNGYDAFASVPDKIANTYIVYALTEAGIGNEIEPEYNFALQKALNSNDAYQLSMMAISASNMRKTPDYNLLMQTLNDLQQRKLFNAETSVTNSREASLRVETKALYAIALLRNDKPDLGKVAGAISEILAEKTYYGYGSTQATVLALQAIVNYSKLMNRVTDGVQVDFVMNGTRMKEDDDLSKQVKPGNNVFAVAFRDDGKTIPYSAEIAYNTLTPPNSAKAELSLQTILQTDKTKVGETVRLQILVSNKKNEKQAMSIAKIGIPAGLSVQPWQLKEIMEQNKAAYYEIFDNYLVFYWMGFAPNETKKINLDLKAEIPGMYRAKASNVYLYYMPEFKNWNEGISISILP